MQRWDSQIKLASKTSYTGELWIQLREPASVNKVEEWFQMILDINFGPSTHMLTHLPPPCEHTYIHIYPCHRHIHMKNVREGVKALKIKLINQDPQFSNEKYMIT